MNPGATVPWAWTRREPPRPPEAVLAWGPAGAWLAHRTVDAIGGGRSSLSVVAGDGWVLVTGEGEELPWADGATYLASEGGVLLPTTHTTAPGPDLVGPAVRRHAGAAADDLVVLVPDRVLVAARPVGAVDLARLVALAGAGR